MTTKTLFEFLIKESKAKSKNEFSEIIGVNPGRVSEWLSGTSIGFDLADTICTKLNIDLCPMLAKDAQNESLTKSAEAANKK